MYTINELEEVMKTSIFPTGMALTKEKVDLRFNGLFKSEEILHFGELDIPMYRFIPNCARKYKIPISEVVNFCKTHTIEYYQED